METIYTYTKNEKDGLYDITKKDFDDLGELKWSCTVLGVKINAVGNFHQGILRDTFNGVYQGNSEKTNVVHSLVVIRNNEIYCRYAANSLKELKDELPKSFAMYLDDAVRYGQEKFFQGETKYNLLYCYWNLMK